MLYKEDRYKMIGKKPVIKQEFELFLWLSPLISRRFLSTLKLTFHIFKTKRERESVPLYDVPRIV